MLRPLPFVSEIARLSVVASMIALLLAGTNQSVLAQTDPPKVEIVDPKPDPTAQTPDFRFSVGWVSTGGAYLFVPEKWSDLHINLVNAKTVAREFVCVTSFDEQPNLQFGRRVWVPARSKIQVTHPVLIPKVDGSPGRSMNLHSLILEGSSTDDVLLKNDSGQLTHDGALLVSRTSRNTGLIGVAADNDESIPPQEVVTLVENSRVSQQLSNKVTLLLDQFLAADEIGLNVFDQIVVAESRIANDFAALAALRHWLFAGGRLWVMLDRVDPVVLERLLGDDFTGHVVDQVGLTTVRIDKASKLADPIGMIGETVDYEVPVEMVRFVTSNMEVMSTVNGWPAALTKKCGDGQIFVTTLGARGWQKPRSAEGRTNDPQMEALKVLSAGMQDLASEVFMFREPELVPQVAIEPQVREYVGYTVPSWEFIVGILFGFFVLLVSVGIWLLRAGKLEHLGWIGSSLAVAVSILLLFIGRSFRHGVPATMASVQLAQTMIGTDDVRTQGLVAVYNPEGAESPIEATRGGRMFPDMTGLEGTVRRFVATDLGVWHWENLKQPAGLRTAAFTRAETVPQRIEARVTLNANGISGKYSGRLAAGTEALVGTRNGRIGASLLPDGTLVALAEEVFEKDQFLKSSFVNDEQDRRRRTLEKLFNNPLRRDFPECPQLMFWTDKWEHGFHFSDNLKTQGATLVCVPLVIERPDDGTEILIPSPLIPYRNRPDPSGIQPSTMWNYGRNEWQERSTPGASWLSFQVPPELLPLAASRARIEIKVTGPVGRIEIKGLKKGTVTSLQTIVDPVGTVVIEIDDSDVLSISPEGRLSLGLYGGDASRPGLTETVAGPAATSPKGNATDSTVRNTKVNYWKIESLTMQLWAKTSEPTLKD